MERGRMSTAGESVWPRPSDCVSCRLEAVAPRPTRPRGCVTQCDSLALIGYKYINRDQAKCTCRGRPSCSLGKHTWGTKPTRASSRKIYHDTGPTRRSWHLPTQITAARDLVL